LAAGRRGAPALLSTPNEKSPFRQLKIPHPPFVSHCSVFSGEESKPAFLRSFSR
jgi:hypothetical protein